MAKFSVGQKVVCIDASFAHAELVEGKIYEVEYFGKLNSTIKLRDVHYPMRNERFEPYKEKEEIMSNTKKPHIHAEMIKAWADGATIEFLVKFTSKWKTTIYPCWEEENKYRIKPEPTKLEPTYPKTTLTKYDIQKIWTSCELSTIDSLVHLSNKAIMNFIVSGEMDKYIESIK